MASSDLSAETGVLNIAGFEIGYYWWGDRTALPIVAFTDFGEAPGWFAPVAEKLTEAGYSMMSFSLPAHRAQGISEPEFIDPNSFADALAQTLHYNEITRCILLAGGFGSRIALPLAVRHLPLIQRLWLISPDGFNPRIDRIAAFLSVNPAARLLQKSDRLAGFIVDHIAPGHQKQYRSVMIGALRKWLASRQLLDFYQNGTLARLYHIDCPVELIWGKEDSINPYYLAGEVRQHFRNVRVHPLEEGGRNVLSSQPERLAAELISLPGRPATSSSRLRW